MIIWRSMNDPALRKEIAARNAILYRMGLHVVTVYHPSDTSGPFTTYDNKPLATGQGVARPTAWAHWDNDAKDALNLFTGEPRDPDPSLSSLLMRLARMGVPVPKRYLG